MVAPGSTRQHGYALQHQAPLQNTNPASSGFGVSTDVARKSGTSVASMKAPTTIEAPRVADASVKKQAEDQQAKAQPAMPTSLKKYIEESFAKCVTPEDRAFVTEELKNIIAKVSSDGRLNIHKWEVEAFPTLPSIKAKQISTAVVIASSSSSSSPASSSLKTGEQRYDNNKIIDKERDNNIRERDNDRDREDKKRKSRWGDETESREHAILRPKIEVSSINTSVALASSSSTVPQVSVPPVSVSAIAPSRLAPTEDELKRRASRFTEAESKKQQRKKRANFQPPVQPDSESGLGSAELNLEKMKVVGTCADIEKDYFRLTSPPDPSTVRPEPVLKKAIVSLKRKWRNDEVEYIYMCSQLKAIRQDLTVQHIRNEFTVDVYEIHARIALECADLNEYNQCQTQLKQLYDSGLSGSEMEFVAYRILYYVYLQGNKKYQSGSSDISYILSTLKPAALRDPAVAHALLIRESVRQECYHRFFKLYQVTPNMGNYIIDLMMDSYRLQTLVRMCKAYKPNLALSFVVDELAFDSLENGEAFVVKGGCILTDSLNDAGVVERMINTKDSVVNSLSVFTQDKLLL